MIFKYILAVNKPVAIKGAEESEEESDDESDEDETPKTPNTVNYYRHGTLLIIFNILIIFVYRLNLNRLLKQQMEM